MSGIVDIVKGIAESITSLPSKIIDGIKEGLKEIFVPDPEALKEDFLGMVERVERSIGLHTDSLEWFKDSVEEQPIEDIDGEYYISGVGNFNLKFFDTQFLKQGVDFFRPLIRGFMVFLLLLYNYRNTLSFIGQDPAIAHHAYEKAKEAD